MAWESYDTGTPEGSGYQAEFDNSWREATPLELKGRKTSQPRSEQIVGGTKTVTDVTVYDFTEYTPHGDPEDELERCVRCPEGSHQHIRGNYPIPPWFQSVSSSAMHAPLPEGAYMRVNKVYTGYRRRGVRYKFVSVWTYTMGSDGRWHYASNTLTRYREEIDENSNNGVYGVPGNEWVRQECPKFAFSDYSEENAYAAVRVYRHREQGEHEATSLDFGNSLLIDAEELVSMGATGIMITTHRDQTKLSLVNMKDKSKPVFILDIDVSREEYKFRGNSSDNDEPQGKKY